VLEAWCESDRAAVLEAWCVADGVCAPDAVADDACLDLCEDAADTLAEEAWWCEDAAFAEPDAEAECALCVDADAIVKAWWWDDAALVTFCVVVFVTVFVLVAAFELVGFGSAPPSASTSATCAPVSTDDSASGHPCVPWYRSRS
jgi:hypothetical protein